MGKILYILAFILILSCQAVAQDVISWKDAGNYIGQTKTVEGKIVATYNSGKACFLNFHQDYKSHFTVVIFQSNFGNFDGDIESIYLFKTVRVKGLIKNYKGKPEIIVSSPEQIEIVAGSTGKDDCSKRVKWDDAKDYYGKCVTIYGKIVKSHNSGKACFLNFHNNYKLYFTAVIFANKFDLFPSSPELFYLNKNVEIRGVVREYKGKPEIILNSPEQIKIID